MAMKIKTPFLGADYYPEDWPEEEMEKDLTRMNELGITVIRVAEFAWHRMEPSEGAYDFSFWHRVTAAAKAHGIGVILGTPTATPPAWFTAKYPDSLIEQGSGRRRVHGGRRHCCSNSPVYNEYSMRIVEKMAQSFADDDAVIGWQIDNEIYSGGTPEDASTCFCPYCAAKFRRFLKERYGTIDNLNEKWDLNLFSQWYDSFEQIPLPRDTWHNPHLIAAYREFQNEGHIEFVGKQADVIHRYSSAPVGTDMMPVRGMDYRHMTEKLDICQFNHYNEPDNLFGAAFWCDHWRTLKERPFWNTETATCWNGSTAINQSVKPDGYCRANSWLPVALGAEANMYWLWRTHWAGHELMHGAVIDTSGRDMIATGEVRETAEGFAAASEFLTGTRVKCEAAIHYTSYAGNMHESQPVVSGWRMSDTVTKRFYHPALRTGLRTDVIDEAQPLDGYRLLITPMTMTLEKDDLGVRAAEWVKNGGTWIVGPLTDVRNIDGARYRDRYFGLLEELTGLNWRYFLPDTKGQIRACWKDGTPFDCDTWFELTDASGNDTQVTVTEGPAAALGKGILSVRKVGMGRVILLGSVPSERDFEKILRMACGFAGIELPEKEGELIVAPRKGEAGEGTVLVEIGGKAAAYTLPKPATDTVTGKEYEGRIEIEPYGVRALKYK